MRAGSWIVNTTKLNKNYLDMNKILEFCYFSICEDFGRPMRLLRLIDEHPNMSVQLTEPNPVVAVSNVVKWQNWGMQPINNWPCHKRGTLLGWKQSAERYSSFYAHRPEFENFGRCEVLDQWNCDIQDVTGLSSSKSNLETFSSLDSMVKTNSKEMIDEITEYKLKKNLSHREIRILNGEGDYFARYRWDGRTFLINSGGSHHFAAARYIASRINRPVPLNGKLYTYSINRLALDSLLCDFDIYAISDETDISIGFHNAMRTFRATYLWQHLPCPYTHARAILLPKNEERSMRVSRVLRTSGMFNIGEHLVALTDRQACFA